MKKVYSITGMFILFLLSILTENTILTVFFWFWITLVWVEIALDFADYRQKLLQLKIDDFLDGRS